jgi:DNA-binding Lrp family transcriptional regulator
MKRLTETDVRVFKKLRSGTRIRARLAEKDRLAVAKEIGVSPSTVTKALRKLEEMGVISGYAPMLTEYGQKVMEGLETLYFTKPDDITVERVKGDLSEMFG